MPGIGPSSFPLGPMPGSRLAIVRSTTQRVSRSVSVRSAPPTKRRRLLRTTVSTRLYCAFLSALAYDMHCSAPCRLWKPRIRRQNLWCALCSSAQCPTSTAHLTYRCNSKSITPAFGMHAVRVNVAVSILYNPHIVQPPPESILACPRESDPSFDLPKNVGGRVDNAAQVPRSRFLSIPLACCFDDERRGTGYLARFPHRHGVRIFSITVRPSVSKASTMTVIIVARLVAELDTRIADI